LQIPPFELERYFAKYEFSSPYLLSCSDCEPLSMKELLSLGDRETLGLWETLTLGYTESQGHPLLREEIAKLYTEIRAENIITAVPEECIFIAMNTILEPGDHVVSVFPGYQSLYQLAETIGCEVSLWKPAEEETWRFRMEDLERLLKPSTKLIVINFPHNPTGALITGEELRQIVAAAEKRRGYVFSDEMYRFLEYDEKDRLPTASDLSANAVSLSGMSKSFSLAGLRIGWLSTQDTALISQFSSFKDYTTICSSAPGEVLAIMGLRARDAILSRNLGIIRENLRLLSGFSAEHSEILKWTSSKAGPIGLGRLKKEINADDFCLDLQKKKGAMLLPSAAYGFGRKHFRLGFGRRAFPEALSKLSEYLSSLNS